MTSKEAVERQESIVGALQSRVEEMTEDGFSDAEVLRDLCEALNASVETLSTLAYAHHLSEGAL